MESILISSNDFIVRLADLKNPEDIFSIIKVLDNYKKDSMGSSPPYTIKERKILANKFRDHPNILVFLIFSKKELVGGAVCFTTFSTFLVGDVINIHDICILKKFRGLGLGRLLMEFIINKARELTCAKVTLEVREDNSVARNLYSSLGFKESTPVMNFWSKKISYNSGPYRK